MTDCGRAQLITTLDQAFFLLKCCLDPRLRPRIIMYIILHLEYVRIIMQTRRQTKFQKRNTLTNLLQKKLLRSSLSLCVNKVLFYIVLSLFYFLQSSSATCHN